jgi:hypothetical protein
MASIEWGVNWSAAGALAAGIAAAAMFRCEANAPCMKVRDSIKWLALSSFLLVLGDGVQHFGKVMMARTTLANIKPDDKYWEDVQDTMRGEGWSVARDVAVMAAQGLIMFSVMWRQPNPQSAANRRQPVTSDTNQTSEEAAAGRSP